MRKVYKNQMVAHLWANRSQDEARSGNGNFYFRNETIYSYGSHFPIAKHVYNDAGEHAILFTTRNYSVSTSGHKADVRSALRWDCPVFMVQHPERDPKGIIDDFLIEFKAAIQGIAKARGTKSNRIVAAKELSRSIDEVATFFGLPVPQLWNDDLEQSYQNALAQQQRRDEERQRERERREREYAEAHKAQLEDWLVGKGDWSPRTPYPMLRVKGEQLETTWGAEVPLQTAIRIFRHAQCCRKAGKRFEASEHPEIDVSVGSFRVDHISEHGDIRAGCHLIPWSESERIASALNLL